MKVVENLNLLQYNSYRLESVAKKAYFPESIEEIEQLLLKHTDYIVLGGGNNVIFSKFFYDKEFLIIRENLSKIEKIDDEHFIVEAGVDMKFLSEFACENSLTGLEYFYDIPGSIGGAIVMNAGSNDVFIEQLVKTITYFDIESKEVKSVDSKDAQFGYRTSVFKRNKHIVLSALIKLKKGDDRQIKEKMQEILKTRTSKQPKEFPNAGSVFKRPEGYYVGKIMDDLNLKGFSIGGAKISEKHGGFIINYNNATGSDIVELIVKIQQIVNDKLNVRLELEQIII